MMASRYKPNSRIPGCSTTDGCCKKARLNAGLEKPLSVVTSVVIKDPFYQLAIYWCRDARRFRDVPIKELATDGPYILDCPPLHVLLVLKEVLVDETTRTRTEKTETTDRAFCVLSGYIFTNPRNEPTALSQCVLNKETFYKELLLAWITSDDDMRGRMGDDTRSVRAPALWIYGPTEHKNMVFTKYTNVSSVVIRNPSGRSNIEWEGCVKNRWKGLKLYRPFRLHLAVVDVYDEKFY